MSQELLDKKNYQWKGGCGFSLVFCTIFISTTLAIKSIVYAAIALFTTNYYIFALSILAALLCICPFVALRKTKPNYIIPLYLVIVSFSYFLQFKSEKLLSLSSMTKDSNPIFRKIKIIVTIFGTSQSNDKKQ